MARRKRTPEENARREKIRELLQLANIGSMDDIQRLFKETIAEFMENGLDAELDDELGYSRYDYKNKNTDNSRNGHSSKTLRTSFGDVEVSVPRDRQGEFEPQLLKKNQTSISQDIEEKILSMYAKGMTTSDIETHIRDIYGVEVSDTTVSRITDKILPIAKEWQQRPLESIYAVVFMDAIHYHVRSEGQIVKKSVYIAIGIDLDGRKDVLGMWVGENESAKYWATVLNSLKNRGIEDIFIACTDNLTGFSAAIEAVFPKTEIQNCIIHQLRNSSKYVSYTHLLLHNFVKHSRNNKDVSALFADSTVLHPHSPPCPPCHPRIVRHEQQRRPLISQFCQNIHNLRTAAAIKISRRFVRQNDGRVVDERTRNRHTLLLSAGKLVRIRLHLIQHTDFAQHFRRTRQTLLLRHARVTQRERHVFRHGVGGKEVEGLEDIPEGLEAQSGFCLVGEVANVLTVEGIVSFGQIIEQTDDVEQRCFAAAGFAGDGDKFALLNVQADAGQRVDGAFAFSVDFLCF